jgi:hypothetical protein
VTTKDESAPRPRQWDFVAEGAASHLPGAKDFTVAAGEQVIPVREVGYRRRVVDAPLKHRDIRIGNWLYLRLASPIGESQQVEVRNPGGAVWRAPTRFAAVADPLRYSPAIHVNQVGYVPAFPKTAMIGYFLGSAGELDVPDGAGFKLVDSRSCQVAYEGRLVPWPDVGLIGTPLPYQCVLEADFTDFKTPGEYRLSVPGLGASFPFLIADGAAAAITRTYALGLYHQRCGTSNSLPFTRFVHAACHTTPAAVPTASDSAAQRFLAESTADYTNNPRHSAPQLKTFDSSLYPFINRRPVDVSGGHHDAGDYSKYTINSAGLIHALVFSADALPGVGALDNLGLPESGDGKSDLLQEAKWEADFLAKMQDQDGGFYFLVYPRTRRYENDVLPDHGDPQIVWPKNTAATTAAVAALAQISSSPLFQKQFPEAAKRYRAKALSDWQFLMAALAKYGRDGAYQKLTHYGDEFMHDDELAWAACELFLATGEDAYQQKLIAWLNPSDPATRRWGWWRLYESYGRAIRSYVFGARTGRIPLDRLNPLYLSRCEAELLAAANDQLRWAQQSAYGTSFPTETKHVGGGGWYFSLDQAFDLAVASALDQPVLNDPRPQYLRAILSNLNYEAGCNPVNVCYITDLGWKRQRELVDQYAMNDRRALRQAGYGHAAQNPQHQQGEADYVFGRCGVGKVHRGAQVFPPSMPAQAELRNAGAARLGPISNPATPEVTVRQRACNQRHTYAGQGCGQVGHSLPPAKSPPALESKRQQVGEQAPEASTPEVVCRQPPQPLGIGGFLCFQVRGQVAPLLPGERFHVLDQHVHGGLSDHLPLLVTEHLPRRDVSLVDVRRVRRQNDPGGIHRPSEEVRIDDRLDEPVVRRAQVPRQPKPPRHFRSNAVKLPGDPPFDLPGHIRRGQ